MSRKVLVPKNGKFLFQRTQRVLVAQNNLFQTLRTAKTFYQRRVAHIANYSLKWWGPGLGVWPDPMPRACMNLCHSFSQAILRPKPNLTQSTTVINMVLLLEPSSGLLLMFWKSTILSWAFFFDTPVKQTAASSIWSQSANHRAHYMFEQWWPACV